jgi:hypothetical protein
MMDHQPIPTDTEFLKLRDDWKELNGRIDKKVADAKILADAAKALQREYLAAEGDNITTIRQKLSDAVTCLRSKLAEAETLRATAFVLSKRLKAVAARWSQAERNLRTTLAEKTAAESAAATVAEIGGAACKTIEKMIRSIVS